jgi:hypothetical protein
MVKPALYVLPVAVVAAGCVALAHPEGVSAQCVVVFTVLFTLTLTNRVLDRRRKQAALQPPTAMAARFQTLARTFVCLIGCFSDRLLTQLTRALCPGGEQRNCACGIGVCSRNKLVFYRPIMAAARRCCRTVSHDIEHTIRGPADTGWSDRRTRD